jgi:hypothetical protein
MQQYLLTFYCSWFRFGQDYLRMHSAVAKIHICTSFYTLSDLVLNNFLSIYLWGPSKNIHVFLHFFSHLSPELLSITNNQCYQINNFMDHVRTNKVSYIIPFFLSLKLKKRTVSCNIFSWYPAVNFKNLVMIIVLIKQATNNKCQWYLTVSFLA